jgi:hypothetical protein
VFWALSGFGALGGFASRIRRSLQIWRPRHVHCHRRLLNLETYPINKCGATLDQGILLQVVRDIYIFMVDCETHNVVYLVIKREGRQTLCSVGH